MHGRLISIRGQKGWQEYVCECVCMHACNSVFVCLCCVSSCAYSMCLQPHSFIQKTFVCLCGPWLSWGDVTKSFSYLSPFPWRLFLHQVPFNWMPLSPERLFQKTSLKVLSNVKTLGLSQQGWLFSLHPSFFSNRAVNITGTCIRCKTETYWQYWQYVKKTDLFSLCGSGYFS